MPIRKHDAQRAVELLEEYKNKLIDSEDADLKTSIDSVKNVLGSDLFKALIDIHEYQEVLSQPVQQSVLRQSFHSIENEGLEKSKKSTNSTFQNTHEDNQHLQMYQGMDFPAYEYEDIILERGSTGLGFSIAGGRDNPVEGKDSSIYITKIIPGGAAADDGRLKVNDAILSVNGVDTRNVCHRDAVEALKMCDSTVRLAVRRIPQQIVVADISPYEDCLDLFISKGNKGLGFSIAGGVSNQHVPGDDGIFITKIIKGGAAEEDGRLQVNDKILSVDGVSLQKVPHETAVAILQSTKNFVHLKISRKPITNFPIQNIPAPKDFQSNAVPHRESDHPAELNFNETGSRNLSSENRPLQLSTVPPLRDIDNHNVALPQDVIDQNITPVLPMEELSRPQHSSLPYSYASADSEHCTSLSNGSFIEEDVPRGPRVIELEKGSEGLGFNVIGGEEDEGVFISRIREGGVADTSGLLHKGDHILAVNEVDVHSTIHDEVVKRLQSAEGSIRMTVEYKPDEYADIENTIKKLRIMNKSLSGSVGILTSEKKTLYVRSLFDYDSSRDSGIPGKGLSFQYGDILHVTNASDDEWWQARRVVGGRDSNEFGVIPSKQRVEKKERARLKQVKFTPSYTIADPRESANVKKKKSSAKFSTKFPFYKSRENLDRVNDQENHVPQNEMSGSEKDLREETVLSYETVIQKRVSYSRPIILLGPLKDRINDDLIAHDPVNFTSCVPHTTREKREHEEDGVDYHFVKSREQMEKDIQNHLFIEAGQYNENLYGTSVQSVRDVAENHKHCILDVSGSAIKRLQAADLWPIAIFIRPKSVLWLMESNKRLVEEQAKKVYERAVKCEQEYGEYFSAVVQGESIDDIFHEILEIIRQQSGPIIWIPVKDEET